MNKYLILMMTLFASHSALAAAPLCQQAAEQWALKDAGRGATLFQDTETNSDGTYNVYTSKNEVDTEYTIGTKLSRNGNSCRVISHSVSDSDSG